MYLRRISKYRFNFGAIRLFLRLFTDSIRHLMAISFNNSKRFMTLSLAALGVVYGDIGTSPLYAFQASLYDLPTSRINVEGILSLIFWALVVVICIKYLIIVLRADNDGEGGIIALTTLLRPYVKKTAPLLFLITIVGVGLIIGDGMLTPTISILGAAQGLTSISIRLSPFVIPITLAILVMLFWIQRKGTESIGIVFGPMILLWFGTIGTLGFIQIIKIPMVLSALDPYYAWIFLVDHRVHALLSIGCVFLVVTGGEALYADLGHFGKNPIRLAWFTVVFPGLLLNYFGQGAYLLIHPGMVNNTFYQISPTWFLPVLLVISLISTVIASQAIISAVFSIIKQTVLLNLLPRLKIVQTSLTEKGQVYLPTINMFLLFGTCALVLGFQTTDKLANAYGFAVNLDMIITTLLVAFIAKRIWKWRISLLIFGVIGIMDVIFLIGNFHKLLDGGWIPLVIASFVAGMMAIWSKGFNRLRELNRRNVLLDRNILEDLNENKLRRLPGTALFITDPYDQSGGSLLHHLKINHLLSENVIFLGVAIEDHPYVPLSKKFEIEEKAEGFYFFTIHYGFTEDINLPIILKDISRNASLPFKLDDIDTMSFFIEIIGLEVSKSSAETMPLWQKHMFSFMLRNALPDIQFYHLPYNRTVAIGTYYNL
jgi:KUP system potassium uptake protein